jgi:hypothetical protein
MRWFWIALAAVGAVVDVDGRERMVLWVEITEEGRDAIA